MRQLHFGIAGSEVVKRSLFLVSARSDSTLNDGTRLSLLLNKSKPKRTSQKRDDFPILSKKASHGSAAKAGSAGGLPSRILLFAFALALGYQCYDNSHYASCLSDHHLYC